MSIIRQQILAFASHASLEILPNEDLNFLKDLTPGTRIYITDISNTKRDLNRNATITCAEKLIAAGMIPVPHIAARRVENVASLENLINRLKSAGVQNVMLIAGSIKSARQFAFDSSLALLETGLFENFNISVAGHPDANWLTTPGVKQSSTALEAKLKKIKPSQNLRIVTQLTFNPDSIAAWSDELKTNDHTAPIRVGLTGPASLEDKISYAKLCEINITNIVLSQGTRLFNMLSKPDPDEMIAQLALMKHQSKPIGGLHFFTFGKAEKTSQFIKALREGHFTMNESDTGFVLNPA